MCGLIGLFGKNTQSFHLGGASRAMHAMRRRGPDDEGIWSDEVAILGHRRLAIQDLDSRAHQPMVSRSGRYIIIFNGEIYNFPQLRLTLERLGAVLRTSSDTEVLVELFELEGAAMLPKLRGMFALAIWDTKARRAFIARDPYGIKPLYYAAVSQGILVASQVKALRATGLVSDDPDALGQAGFWLFGSVPEPWTWFRGIHALPAGTCAWIENGQIAPPSRWWDVGQDLREASKLQASRAEVEDFVRKALLKSVGAHLVADVPVGILLSGGIDSASLLALMLECGARDLSAVTLKFSEFANSRQDEVPIASEVARLFKVSHDIHTVTYDDFLASIPRILHAMDQPTVDGVNTWFATKAASESGLRVVVSGVGGDELFQGYSTFRKTPLLVGLSAFVSKLPLGTRIARVVSDLQAIRTKNSRWRNLLQRATTLQGAWWCGRGMYGPEDLPRLMGTELAREAGEALSPELWIGQLAGVLPEQPELGIAQLESTLYLRNQLLRDSDWASMDHSVELRTPLVDSWLLRELKPALENFREFPRKVLLSRAPRLGLPSSLLRRKKSGFSTPLTQWTRRSNEPTTNRGVARGWVRRLVDEYDDGESQKTDRSGAMS